MRCCASPHPPSQLPTRAATAYRARRDERGVVPRDPQAARCGPRTGRRDRAGIRRGRSVHSVRTMSHAFREAAVRELMPVVRQIARRVNRMVPSAELGDLIGDGSVGLLRAVRRVRFDPGASRSSSIHAA